MTDKTPVTLTSPNGGTMMLHPDAFKKLQAEAKKYDADTGLLAPQQIWYADPAEHPHAYLAVSEETPGTVIVRDGNDESGAALSFSREQWAVVGGDPDASLGEPQGDKEHPAEVTNPDDLHKVPDRDRTK